MRDSNRSWLLVAVPAPVVVAVAILGVGVAVLGYLAGHSGGASARPAPGTRTTAAAGVLLTYPGSWRRAPGATGIPGLGLAHQLVVAPGGDAARAGLVVGELGGGEPSPLPGRWVARLRGLPQTEVVGLGETQAYRYSRVEVPGFARSLTLYAIPSPEGASTAVACYAAAVSAATMRTCEGIVATLRPQRETQSYILTPDPEYAHQVSASLGQVNTQRVALAHAERSPATPATVKALATRLAAGLVSAVAALSELQPPPAASRAQAKLLESLAHVRDAYSALATAAGTAGAASVVMSAARARVVDAEAALATALRSFALLGYRQT